jgi:hypothetical protein
MFEGKIIDNFLSEEECDYFRNTALELNLWGESDDAFWDGRTFYPELMPSDHEFKKNMSIILKRLKKTIIEEYNLENVYADTFHVVRWYPGMFQPPHQDDMENAMYGEHFFKHRAYGAIIYLNDDFEGGETYYPLHDIAIAPVKGRLAVHKGDGNHLHGVNEIKGNTRYTIASFWGIEKEYDNEY